MSYDISFKVKVEGLDKYVGVGNCTANTTWNVGKMIRLSTGLPWNNCKNNGYCKDVIPHIAKGLGELLSKPQEYKQYESPNGWGTVEGTIRFFRTILDEWETFCKFESDDVVDVTTFWIE